MPGLKGGFGRLASLDELFEILLSHVPTLDTETVPLDDALGRVTGAGIVSTIDVPGFAKSAMDGYAVRSEDVEGATTSAPKKLHLLGEAHPGRPAAIEVAPGTCIEIGTGAVLPRGADAVVMVETTEREGSSVLVSKPVARRENLIERASDIKAGDVVVDAGTLIAPRHVGVIAAVGRREVEVMRRPEVALLSTGPELVPVGTDLGEGEIYDINSHTLAAALRLDGAQPIELGIIPDDPELLEKALVDALSTADLVLLSGGSSLGGGDIVVDVFGMLGEVKLHGVAVKPGKPVVVALAPSPRGGGDLRTLLIGLPGYPVSALSDYYIFVRPLLRTALGLPREEPVYREARLERKHASAIGRFEFLAVRLEGDLAIPLTAGSSSISSLARADGFVEIHENVEVVGRGQPVRVRLL